MATGQSCDATVYQNPLADSEGRSFGRGRHRLGRTAGSCSTQGDAANAKHAETGEVQQQATQTNADVRRFGVGSAWVFGGGGNMHVEFGNCGVIERVI